MMPDDPFPINFAVPDYYIRQWPAIIRRQMRQNPLAWRSNSHEDERIRRVMTKFSSKTKVPWVPDRDRAIRELQHMYDG